MGPRIKKLELNEERKIVTGMIVSDSFLEEVRSIYQPELMKGPHLRKVANWCLSYFEKYKVAPKREIQGIFESHVRKGRMNEEDEKFIRRMLSKLSKEWEDEEEFNEEYLLDQTEEYFKKVSLKNLAEDIEEALSGERRNPKAKDWEEGERLVMEYRRVERPRSAGVNPFIDESTVHEAFETREEELFRMPGDLGRMLGPFTRDSFGAFMGPEKRGKSFWLQETGMRALKAGCKVAFFSVGDMSFNQMVLRFYVYLSKKHYRKRYCKEILLPTVDCYWNQIDSCDMKQRVCDIGVIEDPDKPRNILKFEEADGYVPCSVCRKDDPRQFRGAVWYKVRPEVEPLHWKEAFTKGTNFANRYGSKSVRLISFPNNSISVMGIRSVLSRWEEQGFIPDVILIDYADILAPVDGRRDFRHQQNETWQELRALSQERHCCVFTATQADARAYDAKSIRETHFSEDKRKYGHVNQGIITLNQDRDDKRRMIMRIGQMFVREDDFDIGRKVVVLQGLPIGRPYLDSFIEKF